MIQFIGSFAGALLAIALVPQVYKSYKTKPTADLSFMNSMELSLTVSLIIVKLIYK